MNRDILTEIFKMQKELNEKIWTENEWINPFTYDTKVSEFWLNNYINAMSNELEELRNSTNWKWWRTKVNLFDEQNCKVELIDILHFWISACLILGMSAEDVFRMYCQKHKVNINRQDSGYKEKDENDCRHIE